MKDLRWKHDAAYLIGVFVSNEVDRLMSLVPQPSFSRVVNQCRSVLRQQLEDDN